jgi:hypothetical protein
LLRRIGEMQRIGCVHENSVGVHSTLDCGGSFVEQNYLEDLQRINFEVVENLRSLVGE